jgi:hypothetical protein
MVIMFYYIFFLFTFIVGYVMTNNDLQNTTLKNKRSNNTNTAKNRRWTQVLRKGEQLLLCSTCANVGYVIYIVGTMSSFCISPNIVGGVMVYVFASSAIEHLFVHAYVLVSSAVERVSVHV